MERKRFSVLFFIKRSKLLKNGEAPVRVRVTYDRLYVELQLKRSVKVPLWSQEKEKSTGKDRNSVELNHYIDALRVKFYQIYQDLELEGKIISARAIVNRYQGKDETFKTLYNVFKEHNDNCRKLIGTDYADITVRRYDNCLKYLMELVRRDYKVDDMLLREVNGELVRKFDLYLKTEKHCAQKYRYPVHEMLQKSDKPCHCQRVADKEPICRNQVSRGRGKQTVPKPSRDKPDMAGRVQD